MLTFPISLLTWLFSFLLLHSFVTNVDSVRMFASCTYPSFCDSEAMSGSPEYFLKVMQIKKVLSDQKDFFKLCDREVDLFLLPPLHFGCLLSELEIVLISPHEFSEKEITDLSDDIQLGLGDALEVKFFIETSLWNLPNSVLSRLSLYFSSDFIRRMENMQVIR